LTYFGSFIFVLEPYSVAYLTNIGVGSQFVTLAVGIGTGIAAAFALLGSVLADFIGRRRILVVAALSTSIVAFPFFLLLNTLVPLWIIVAYLMFACVNQLGGGPVNVLFPEQFPTRYRYSGSGLCFQFAGLLGGIMAGFLLPAIIAIESPTGAWPYVALTMLVMGLVGAVAIIPLRETKDAILEN
jgi:MFS family permease